MKIVSVIIVLGLSIASAGAQESCLDSNRLSRLDGEWEKALLKSNVEFLESILANDFIWFTTSHLELILRNHF